MGCFGVDRICFKFVIAAIISIGTTVAAMVMLMLDRFQNTALTSFCTSLIGINLGYWCDPPTAVDNATTQRSENSLIS